MSNKIQIGDNVVIPAYGIEYREGGHVLYVHGLMGATLMRIKCKGVVTNVGCENICAHTDMYLPDTQIDFCMSVEDVGKETSPANLLEVVAFRALIRMIQEEKHMPHEAAVTHALEKMQEQRAIEVGAED